MKNRTTIHMHRKFLSMLLALVLGSFLSIITPHMSYAAHRTDSSIQSIHNNILQPHIGVDDDPMGSITTKITDLTKKLAKFATPLASLAIVFVLVMYVFGGLMPELVQQYKGFIIRALLIVVIIGFIPDIVNAFAGLSGS